MNFEDLNSAEAPAEVPVEAPRLTPEQRAELEEQMVKLEKPLASFCGRYAFERFKMPDAANRAGDFAHNAIVKALRHLDQFHADANLMTWLAAIAVNDIKDYMRRSEHKTTGPLGVPNDEVDATSDFLEFGGVSASTESGLIAKMDVERIMNSVRNARGPFAKENAELAKMIFEEGRSYADAGEKLGLSEKTVKNRVFRLRERIKGEFPEYSGK